MSLLEKSLLKLLGLASFKSQVTSLNSYESGVPWYLYTDPLNIVPTGKVIFEHRADNRVCAICDEHDGEIYDFYDMDKPHPPLHPNCRCIYRYEPTGEVIDYSDESEFFR